MADLARLLTFHTWLVVADVVDALVRHGWLRPII